MKRSSIALLTLLSLVLSMNQSVNAASNHVIRSLATQTTPYMVCYTSPAAYCAQQFVGGTKVYMQDTTGAYDLWDTITWSYAGPTHTFFNGQTFQDAYVRASTGTNPRAPGQAMPGRRIFGGIRPMLAAAPPACITDGTCYTLPTDPVTIAVTATGSGYTPTVYGGGGGGGAGPFPTTVYMPGYEAPASAPNLSAQCQVDQKNIQAAQLAYAAAWVGVAVTVVGVATAVVTTAGVGLVVAWATAPVAATAAGLALAGVKLQMQAAQQQYSQVDHCP